MSTANAELKRPTGTGSAILLARTLRRKNTVEPLAAVRRLRVAELELAR